VALFDLVMELMQLLVPFHEIGQALEQCPSFELPVHLLILMVMDFWEWQKLSNLHMRVESQIG